LLEILMVLNQWTKSQNITLNKLFNGANWYSYAEKRYNDSSIVIMFLYSESWVSKNTLVRILNNVIMVQKWIRWIIIMMEENVERFTERYQRFDCLTNFLTSLLIFRNVITILWIVICFIKRWTLDKLLHNDTLW
jgi:hypothetical protein